jgi:hypothetical protein
LFFSEFDTLSFPDQSEELKYTGETIDGKAWGKGLMTYKSGELRYGASLKNLFFFAPEKEAK